MDKLSTERHKAPGDVAGGRGVSNAYLGFLALIPLDPGDHEFQG